MTRQQVLDLYFMDARSKLIDIAVKHAGGVSVSEANVRARAGYRKEGSWSSHNK